MSYRRNATGLLGLLAVVVLGAMAFASSAWALTPLFNIGGSTTLEATVSGEQEGAEGIIGRIVIPTLNLSIQCTESEVKEGLLLKGGTVGHVKLLDKGCRVFEFKSPFSELPCHVSDVAGGKPELLHITSSSVLLPVEFLDGTFGALVEKIVKQINFLKETGCPLTLKNVAAGTICFKIVSGNNTAEPLIQSNQTIQGECPLKDKLQFGTNESFIVGSGRLFGVGAHAGKTLGVSLL